jgi:glycosyltransferase involved in cell wall biosynthesis
VRVALIIPVLNEQASIGRVLTEIPSGVVDQVLVVDGGSTDGTAEAVRAAGAILLRQRGRGYGAACMTGAVDSTADVLVFLDGDYSDPPAEIPRLLQPLLRGDADLVLGSRENPMLERGALPAHARAGNRLATLLLRLLYGLRVSDLPSFKVIRREHLLGLGIRDLHYGWTAEMIARGAQSGLRVQEVSISYRARIGESKVSGTLGGSVRAGFAILRAVVGVRVRRDSARSGCRRR